MKLKNLHDLALQAQQDYDTYDKQEIILSRDFKSAVSKLKNTTKESIRYTEHTTILNTGSNLTITFPNQWFFIASYFINFLDALKEYKNTFNTILSGEPNIKEIIKNAKESSTLPQAVTTKITSYFREQEDQEYFTKYLTDYSWWYGNKTIDRGDYFVSPILSLAKVVNVSQSYIADIAYFLSDNPFLIALLQKSTIVSNTPKEAELLSIKAINFDDFQQNLDQVNLHFDKAICTCFISSLLTKPFVILTGLSGSGKTKLAQAFAMWICASESQYCIVPVGADWTNREPLLGFPNALSSGEYVKPDHGSLNLIIEASKNSEKPYFLILDEMNLSHVERYFADFLSIMESKGKVCLHSGTEDWNDVPFEISLPTNFFIIGTVNIDETTYMFSPKVLDRANVIEFRVTAKEMEAYLSNNKPLTLDNLKGVGAGMAESFLGIAREDSIAPKNQEEINKVLLTFFSELKKTGAEFGYRSAAEILRFAGVVNKIESNWTMDQILDAAIMQKLLPKVHGSRRKLEPVLKTLGGFCLQSGTSIEEYLIENAEPDFDDNLKVKYPVSLEKILRMYRGLMNNSFTSYAEA